MFLELFGKVFKANCSQSVSSVLFGKKCTKIACIQRVCETTEKHILRTKRFIPLNFEIVL